MWRSAWSRWDAKETVVVRCVKMGAKYAARKTVYDPRLASAGGGVLPRIDGLVTPRRTRTARTPKRANDKDAAGHPKVSVCVDDGIDGGAKSSWEREDGPKGRDGNASHLLVASGALALILA